MLPTLLNEPHVIDGIEGQLRAPGFHNHRYRAFAQASFPGEHRLLEVVDPRFGVREQPHLLELKEDRPGRRVDQVVPQRHLDDGTVAFRDVDEPCR